MSVTRTFFLGLLCVFLEEVLAQNKPGQCYHLYDMEIDGNWYNDSGSEIDWSLLMKGTRLNRTDTTSNWAETQSQCTDTETEEGVYINDNIFCDTFGNTEKSLLIAGQDDYTPGDWVPLVDKPALAKSDLTNAYYAGSNQDLIICASFERVSTNGASYVDMEFNQAAAKKYNDTTATTCAAWNDLSTRWQCLYPDRVDGDLQISFEVGNEVTTIDIVISRYNTSKPHGEQWEEKYRAPETSLTNGVLASSDGAFEAAVNTAPIDASWYGFIGDTKDWQNPWTTIPTGAFFETCIDFTKLGYNDSNPLCFSSLIIKTKSTVTGSLKDTSGVLDFEICGPTPPPVLGKYNCPDDFTDAPTTPRPSTVNPTAGTTANPTNPTQTPTTAQPTQQPTTASPTTAYPTGVPTTAQPTSPTQPPTTPDPTTARPTYAPFTTTWFPSRAPTDPTTAYPTTGEPTTPGPTLNYTTTAGSTTAESTSAESTEVPETTEGEDSGDAGGANQGDWVGQNTTLFLIILLGAIAFILYWVVGGYWYKHRQSKRPVPGNLIQNDSARNVEMNAPAQEDGWKSEWQKEQANGGNV